MVIKVWFKHTTRANKAILPWLLFTTLFLTVLIYSKCKMKSTIKKQPTTTTKSTTTTTTNPFDNNKMKYYMTSAVLEPSRSLCAGKPYLVILVESNIYHNRKRFAMRRMLPVYNPEVTRIFVMGNNTKDSPMIQKRMETEQSQRKDILIGSFPEDHKYNTYKTLLGLRWVSKECGNATYILKISENCSVDLKRTFHFLRNLENFDKNNLVVGHKFVKKIPVRDPKVSHTDHNYVSWDEYAGLFFPPFVSGQFYVTTPQVATRLTNEAWYHKYLFLEDVFVTGILTKALNIPIRDINEIRNDVFNMDLVGRTFNRDDVLG